MLFILAIAAIIGLFIAVSKSIRFLRQEDTKSSKKWAWIAVAIVLSYALVVFIFNKLFPSTAKNTLGNIGISIFSNKYKLKENEVRSSGKPYSNFDVISNSKVSITGNRVEYLMPNKVLLYETSDPDFNADGNIKMGFANKEIAFSDDITLKPDAPYGNEANRKIQEFAFKKGVIYKASVSAPTDFPAGLYVNIGNNQYLYLSYMKGGLINQSVPKIN